MRGVLSCLICFLAMLSLKESLPSLLGHGVSLIGEQLTCGSSKRRKEFLVLTCGQRSVNSSVAKGKNEDGESCSDEDSEDEENQTVSFTTFIIA